MQHSGLIKIPSGEDKEAEDKILVHMKKKIYIFFYLFKKKK